MTGILGLLPEQGVSWPLGQHADSNNDLGKLGTPLKLLHGISESSHLEEFALWRLFGLEFKVKDGPQSDCGFLCGIISGPGLLYARYNSGDLGTGRGGQK